MFSFEECIEKLNCLNNIPRSSDYKKKYQLFLLKSGIQRRLFDELKVIHVSGSKGKGHVCHYTEQILRSYGYKTGLFTSPHVISCRERIKINGKNVSKEIFRYCFTKIYNSFYSYDKNLEQFPGYFVFMFFLAIYIFSIQRCQVVIIETGIGGELDITNIIPNTQVVGITSIELEHTNILGKNLSEIVYQKAGIIKPLSNVYVTESTPLIHDIIVQRFKEKKGKKFLVVPYLDDIILLKHTQIPFNHHIQKENLALALFLAADWLKQNRCVIPAYPTILDYFKTITKDEIYNELSEQSQKLCLNSAINFSNNYIQPNLITRQKFYSKNIFNLFLNPESLYITKYCLSKLEHPIGRFQKKIFNQHHIYLDGAHTIKSLFYSSEWFFNNTQNNQRKKILVFLERNRNYEDFLTILLNKIKFDKVIFPKFYENNCCDNISNTLRVKSYLNFCYENTFKFESIYIQSDTIYNILTSPELTKDCFDILIVGSFYLVGNALKTLAFLNN